MHLQHLQQRTAHLAGEQDELRRQNELLQRHVQLLKAQPHHQQMPCNSVKTDESSTTQATVIVKPTPMLLPTQPAHLSPGQSALWSSSPMTVCADATAATGTLGSFGRFAAPQLPPELILHICANLLQNLTSLISNNQSQSPYN